jgi:hypothetical protein
VSSFQAAPLSGGIIMNLPAADELRLFSIDPV